jgi:dolichol-phosphate mannosyltransferase
MSPQLSIIVPTLNERDNIARLHAALVESLAGLDWELLIADGDSGDGTPAEVEALARRNASVRLLRLQRSDSLSMACIAGMRAARAEFLAVTDADLQHDVRLLPRMLTMVRDEGFDLVSGSRYLASNTAGDGLSFIRRTFSRAATLLSRAVLPVKLTDPMSGFFLLRRSVLDAAEPRLTGLGFKLLLDIVTAVEGKVKCAELSYRMSPRRYGASKLDARVALDWLRLVLRRVRGAR